MQTVHIQDAIRFIEAQIEDPSQGLPEDVFRLTSRITPLVNVDLLIQDDDGRTLLAWRNDLETDAGWHVPGGIVRYKESFEARLQKVAETELGANVTYDATPLAVHQMIYQELVERGHFISFLYRCYLPRDYVTVNGSKKETDLGYLRWHQGCPDDILAYHEVYRPYMEFC